MNLTLWRTNIHEPVTRLRRLEGAYPKAAHTSPVFSKSKFKLPSSTVITPKGLINPLSAVQAKGNLSPYVLSGNVGFTADNGSITAYWDGSNASVPLIVKRADGTSFSVPAGTMAIGGLQSGVSYGFAIFLNVNNGRGLSFGPGDTGNPRVAISPGAASTIINAALQAQQAYSAEPIYAGLVYFSTTSGGSSASASGAGRTSSGVVYSNIRVRGLNTA